MAAVLFNDVEPFEHIVNILSIEGSMWNLVKIAFKDYMIFKHVYSQGQGRITPGDKILIVTKNILLPKLYSANFSHQSEVPLRKHTYSNI